MKRRLRTLQTMMRVANCRIEVARVAYAKVCTQRDEARAKHDEMADLVEALERELFDSLGSQGELSVDDWQLKTRHLANEHARLAQQRQQVERLDAAVDDARDVLQGHARDHAVAEKLGERTALEIAREGARREGIAQDEQWVLLEERRR